MSHSSITIDLFPSTARRLLKSLCGSMPEEVQCWLVGGALRDLQEGKQPNDLDLAFNGLLTIHLQRWAQQEKGNWFWLDRQRKQSRVIFKDLALCFDFAPLRGTSIEEDLRRRDFTLNAMAVELKALVQNSPVLIDPLGGRSDLKQRVLRMCGPQVLQDDPLRVLKGFRHMAQHDWSLEAQTHHAMRQAVPLLSRVAAERLRTELGMILASPRLVTVLPLLHELGILKSLFGQLAALPANIDVCSERLLQLDASPHFGGLIRREIEAGFSCRALLALAFLLGHFERAVLVEEVTRSLRLSRRSGMILKALCTQPELSLHKLSTVHHQRRAALQLERFAPCPVERLLFALVSTADTTRDILAADYLRAFHEHSRLGEVEDLLAGDEIARRCAVPPGPAIGYWQQRIKEAEINGEITDRESAQLWLEKQFSN